MYKFYQKDNKKLFAGTVENVKTITKDGANSVIVTLSDFTDENIDIFFNNNDVVHNADLVRKAGVKEGAYIAVLAKCSEDEKTGTGLDFKFKGQFTFKEEGKSDINVFIGTVVKPNSPRENIFSVAIPVDVYKDGNKDTIWHNISFFDSEYNGKVKNNAQKAKRVMGDNERATAVIVAGPVKEKEYNGKIFHSAIGYRMIRK